MNKNTEDTREFQVMFFYGNTIVTTTPYELVKTLEKPMEFADEEALLAMKKMVLEAIQNYRAKYGEDNQTINNLRRKMNRILDDRKNQQGTTPIPNTIIRNTFYGDKLIESWKGLGTIETNGDPQITESTSKILSSRAAGYILDAVGNYVNTYYKEGENPNMNLASDGKYYVISDTFDAFCKKADITGDTRRLVKESLFPADGKKGILEDIKFILPQKGNKKRSVVARFISARFTLTQSNERLKQLNKGEDSKQENDETILAFEMDVHAGVYDFLSQREELLAGRSAQVQDGFQNTPMYLNAKIERQLKHIQYISGSLYGTVLRGDLEKYRQAVLYCINKWNTGKDKRKNNMTVTWEEIYSNLDNFPKHTKRKERRLEEFQTLNIVLNGLKDNDTLEGCTNIEKQIKPLLALVFHIKKELPQQ